MVVGGRGLALLLTLVSALPSLVTTTTFTVHPVLPRGAPIPSLWARWAANAYQRDSAADSECFTAKMCQTTQVLHLAVLRKYLESGVV